MQSDKESFVIDQGKRWDELSDKKPCHLNWHELWEVGSHMEIWGRRFQVEGMTNLMSLVEEEANVAEKYSTEICFLY